MMEGGLEGCLRNIPVIKLQSSLLTLEIFHLRRQERPHPPLAKDGRGPGPNNAHIVKVLLPT